MDLRAHSFQCFILLAEELSFTRAAERAGLTQSALSMRIRGMEQQLGLDLFHRSSRAVSLTTAGAELIDQARRIVTETDRFQSLCDQLRATPETPLLLAMPLTMLGNSQWMELVERFRSLEPRIETHVSRHATPDVVTAIESGRADIGFVAGRPPAHLATIVLKKWKLGLALPEEWPEARRTDLGSSDLAGMKIAAFDPEVNPGLHAECFDDLKICGADLIRAPEGLLGAGFAGRERIAMLAFPGARHILDAQKLRVVPLKDIEIRASLCAVRKEDASRRSIRRFWEMARSGAASAA